MNFLRPSDARAILFLEYRAWCGWLERSRVAGGIGMCAVTALVVFLASLPSRSDPSLPGLHIALAGIGCFAVLVLVHVLFGGPASLRSSETLAFDLAGMEPKAMFIACMARTGRECAAIWGVFTLVFWYAVRLPIDSIAAIFLCGIALCLIQATAVVAAKRIRSAKLSPLIAGTIILSVAAGAASILAPLNHAVPLWVALVPVCLYAFVLILATADCLTDCEWIPGLTVIAFRARNGTGGASTLDSRRRLWSICGLACAVAGASALFRMVDGVTALWISIALFTSLAGFARSGAVAYVRCPVWPLANEVTAGSLTRGIADQGLAFYVCACASMVVAAWGRVHAGDLFMYVLLGVLCVTTGLQARFAASWWFERFGEAPEIADAIIAICCSGVGVLPLLLAVSSLPAAFALSVALGIAFAYACSFAVQRRGFPAPR